MADLQTNLQRLENNSDEILSLVSDISDAIAAKGGTVPANTGLRGFANAINSIPSHLGTKSITADGTYIATDDNLDGYSSVTVEVTPPINTILEAVNTSLETSIGPST